MLKFIGGVAEPVPRDSGSRRETDTVTDPVPGCFSTFTELLDTFFYTTVESFKKIGTFNKNI